jgi:hypothetical protein
MDTHSFIKYQIYKPIRNGLNHYLYGYYLTDDLLIERQKNFIKGIRERNDKQWSK